MINLINCIKSFFGGISTTEKEVEVVIDLYKLKKKELIELAKEKGISIKSNDTKAKIIAKLEE